MHVSYASYSVPQGMSAQLAAPVKNPSTRLPPPPRPRSPLPAHRPPGRQVFLYKRAQIFVGDVYGAYGGKGLGAFWDVDQLTMFADYRCVQA